MLFWMVVFWVEERRSLRFSGMGVPRGISGRVVAWVMERDRLSRRGMRRTDVGAMETFGRDEYELMCETTRTLG